MIQWFLICCKHWNEVIHDSHLKNSFFIFLSTVVNAGTGFIFWMLAAKWYPPAAVGIATSVISLAGLVVLASRFGFDFSILRFFPEKDKGEVFGTALGFVSIFALIIGIPILLNVEILFPELSILAKYPIIFICLVIANATLILTGTAFIAIKRAQIYFAQSALTGSRIFFLFLLTFFGAVGIIGSFCIATLLVSLCSLLILATNGIHVRKFSSIFFKESFSFSSGNYIAELLNHAPNLILPIITLSVLGPMQAAHFFIAYSIASVIYMAPHAISMSMLVEGSYGQLSERMIVRSVKTTLLLITIFLTVLFFTGEYFLSFIHSSYSEAINLLYLIAISSYPLAVIYVYQATKRVQKDIKSIVALNAVTFILLIVLSYFFMNVYGLDGIGYAWIISYGSVAGIISIHLINKRSRV